MTETKPVFHASALPMFFECPAMAHIDGNKIDMSNRAALIGTATHDTIKFVCEHNTSLEIAMGQLSGFNETELSEISRMAETGINYFFRSCDRGKFEVTLEAEFPLFKLRGRADVIEIDNEEAFIPDWKTTRLKDADYTAQMLAYAAMIFDDYAHVKKVTTAAVYLRDNTHVVKHIYKDSPELEDFFHKVNRVTKWDGKTFNIGDQCVYCKRIDCPALREHMAAAVSLAGTNPDIYEANPDDNTVIEAYSALALLKKKCERHVDAIKIFTRRKFGLSGEKYDLVIETKRRKSIDALKGWPILSKELTEEELAAATTIGITKAKDAIKNKTLKNKTGAVREFMERLEAAGAIVESTFDGIRKVKK